MELLLCLQSLPRFVIIFFSELFIIKYRDTPVNDSNSCHLENAMKILSISISQDNKSQSFSTFLAIEMCWKDSENNEDKTWNYWRLEYIRNGETFSIKELEQRWIILAIIDVSWGK